MDIQTTESTEQLVQEIASKLKDLGSEHEIQATIEKLLISLKRDGYMAGCNIHVCGTAHHKHI